MARVTQQESAQSTKDQTSPEGDQPPSPTGTPHRGPRQGHGQLSLAQSPPHLQDKAGGSREKNPPPQREVGGGGSPAHSSYPKAEPETTQVLPLLRPWEKEHLGMLGLCSVARVLAGLPTPPRDTLCQAELVKGGPGGLAGGTSDPLATLPAQGWGATYHLPWGARGGWPLPGL